MAKQKGAKIIRDVWEEKDEFGIIRFATLKTVSYMKKKKINN